VCPSALFSLATTSKTPDDQRRPVENCNHGPISQPSQKLYFCLGGISQKVHLPYQTLRGQIPRKLAIERYEEWEAFRSHPASYCFEGIPQIVMPDSLVRCDWSRQWATIIHKYTRAKGKTAPKKDNVAPDITRRGKKCPHNLDNLIVFYFWSLLCVSYIYCLY